MWDMAKEVYKSLKEPLLSPEVRFSPLARAFKGFVAPFSKSGLQSLQQIYGTDVSLGGRYGR